MIIEPGQGLRRVREEYMKVTSKRTGCLSLFSYYNNFIFCICVVILSDLVGSIIHCETGKFLSSAPTPPKCY